MIEKVEKWYPGEGKLTTGRAVLYVILMLGLISAVIRLFFGLGATTNLNDAYPWGLWISFDVLSGVALAAGGFTMAAAIYIFNLKKFEPLLRPAKLSAFIGYLVFVVGLFFDLGQPWRIWHPMVMWNPHSVLFEVSWCVMLYTTVLGVDIFIMALERWKKYEWVSFSPEHLPGPGGGRRHALHPAPVLPGGAVPVDAREDVRPLGQPGHRAALFHQRGDRRHERGDPGEPHQRLGV